MTDQLATSPFPAAPAPELRAEPRPAPEPARRRWSFWRRRAPAGEVGEHRPGPLEPAPASDPIHPGALAPALDSDIHRGPLEPAADAEIHPGPAPAPPPAKARKSWREQRWERRRRRRAFEEALGWVLVPIIVISLYWAVKGGLSALGTSPSGLIQGFQTVLGSRP